MKPIVSLKDVSVVYSQGRGNEVAAVKNVSLEIYPEEYVILFGPSGSGKSTILYLIAGLQKPSNGEVFIEDQNLYKLSEQQIMEFHRSVIGFIFQAFYLVPNLSIRDNIALPQIFKNIPVKDRKGRVAQLAQRFGLVDRLSKKPSELSGGQQQRVAAARALINDPQLILADEPVGNLDTKNATIMMDLLRELNKKDKKTVILVTHNPDYLPYAHRVFYIQDGRLIKEEKNTSATKPGQGGYLDNPVVQTEMTDLAQRYPYLDINKLRVKALVKEMLIPYDEDEQEKMAVMIEQYLGEKIDEQQLVQMFDQSRNLGLSLDSETAIRLMRKIMDIKGELQTVRAPVDLKHPVESKSEELAQRLIESHQLQLTKEQIQRLRDAVEKRLLELSSPEEFEIFLLKPFSEGGVGMNKKNAQKISKRLEVVLTAKDIVKA